MSLELKILETESDGRAVADACNNCRSLGATCVMHPAFPNSNFRRCLICMKGHKTCLGAGTELQSMDALQRRAERCCATMAAESSRLSYIIGQLFREASARENFIIHGNRVAVGAACEQFCDDPVASVVESIEQPPNFHSATSPSYSPDSPGSPSPLLSPIWASSLYSVDSCSGDDMSFVKSASSVSSVDAPSASPSLSLPSPSLPSFPLPSSPLPASLSPCPPMPSPVLAFRHFLFLRLRAHGVLWSRLRLLLCPRPGTTSGLCPACPCLTELMEEIGAASEVLGRFPSVFFIRISFPFNQIVWLAANTFKIQYRLNFIFCFIVCFQFNVFFECCCCSCFF